MYNAGPVCVFRLFSNVLFQGRGSDGGGGGGAMRSAYWLVFFV